MKYRVREKIYRFLDLVFVKYLFFTNTKLEKGTENWLIYMEWKYGGYVSGVPRKKVSDKDPRTVERLQWGGMVGGDRMSDLHQGYGKYYARYLLPLVSKNTPVTLVEVGILKGTGLAIWSNLFSSGRILGLDIDLEHTRSNINKLKKRGAFANNNVELHEFDQFDDNSEFLSKILKGNKIDVMIDDGIHMDKAIMTTIESALPHLADCFLYFIEDNKTVATKLKSKYPNLNFESFGKFTVITPNSAFVKS